MLRSFAPDAVLGMGGYTQVPALLAARVAGIPSALHEQNAIAGRANLVLARVVQRVLVSAERSTDQFPSGKAVWTGLPVRSQFFSSSAEEDHAGFNVLVLGGSQGAYFLNRLVVDTLSALESVRDRLRFAHQTGEGDHPWVDEAYRRGGFRAEVRPFFHDVHRVLRRADLVVSRAGASSLAELAAVGRGAVLVPYPFAVKDHQYANAMAFQAEGAAFVFRQEEIQSNRLASLIHGLIASPDKTREMGRKAQRLSQPDAAARVCEELERIAGGGTA